MCGPRVDADPAGRAVAAPAIKPIRSVMDAHAFVPADVVALARWTAEYYAAGVGDTIPALLPPMARGGRVDAHKTTRVATITVAGTEALAAPEALTAKQREALELLAGAPTGIATLSSPPAGSQPTPSRGWRSVATSACVRIGSTAIRSQGSRSRRLRGPRSGRRSVS